jgi:hypothetical protein
MTVWLKQSTAATVMVGPIVDSTDGATAETGFTISQADIRLSKNGGAFAQTNNATGASHAENGWYAVPLDTTDTATLGSLLVNIAESGGLQAWRTFMVVPANVWDSMFGADRLQVHVDEMTAGIITASVLASDAITAANVAADVITELQSGLATASALSTVAGYIDTEVAAIKAKTDNLPASPAATSDIPSAAAVADAVWDEARAGHVTSGTFGEGVASVQGSVSSIATNGIAASSFSAGSITSNAVAQNAAYEIADAVFARGDIDGLTFDEVLKVFAAILAGKVSGAATATNVFRDLADTLDRVTTTADADGNRSAVTINV